MGPSHWPSPLALEALSLLERKQWILPLCRSMQGWGAWETLDQAEGSQGNASPNMGVHEDQRAFPGDAASQNRLKGR